MRHTRACGVADASLDGLKAAPFLITLLAVMVLGRCLAADVQYNNQKYGFSLTFPTGWVQIPDAELADLRSALPPEAQTAVYEAAFQRGHKRGWFEWPYLIVQVIPPERTKLHRLPTETEFGTVISGMTGAKKILERNGAVASIPDADDRKTVQAFLDSMDTAPVQVDVPGRRYWYVAQLNDPRNGASTMLLSGVFLPTGTLAQLNAYTSQGAFSNDVTSFIRVDQSLKYGAIATRQRATPPALANAVPTARLPSRATAAPEAASQLDDAAAAIGRGDDATAKRLLRPLAEQGNARAQLTIGLLLYKGGKSRAQDYVDAAKWFRRSADQGNAVAQSVLGIMFGYGLGVPQDYAEAMRWYRKSADQGNADAEAALGIGFFNGQGLPQNYVEGMKWLRKSADQGNADGEYLLGLAFAKGQAVPQDYFAANTWFRKSADQGNAASQSMLGFNCAAGRGIAQNPIEALKWDILAAAQPAETQNNPDASALRDLAIKNREVLTSRLSAAQVAAAQALARDWKPQANPH